MRIVFPTELESRGEFAALLERDVVKRVAEVDLDKRVPRSHQ